MDRCFSLNFAGIHYSGTMQVQTFVVYVTIKCCVKWRLPASCAKNNMQLPSRLAFLCLMFVSCTVNSAHFSKTKLTVTKAHYKSLQPRSYQEVKKYYDTLIPVMSGLFITYDSFDYHTYQQYINKLLPAIEQPKDSLIYQLQFYSEGRDGFSLTGSKWGVIDSTGNVIVPFICDAVRELENGKGIFSIYKDSRSLNTGLPRYNYTGYYYFFDQRGIVEPAGKLFEITTIFIADFHRAEFVITQGNAFYLPAQYVVPGKGARGAVSKEYIKPRRKP